MKSRSCDLHVYTRDLNDYSPDLNDYCPQCGEKLRLTGPKQKDGGPEFWCPICKSMVAQKVYYPVCVGPYGCGSPVLEEPYTEEERNDECEWAGFLTSTHPLCYG